MIVDCHVHVCATLPGHGVTSRLLRRRFSFAYIRLRLGLPFWADDVQLEREVEAQLVKTVSEAEEIDAAVVLAFDAAYTDDGQRDDARTNLEATNDYVAELVRKHPKFLFGASVHPYRPDALQELEKCVANGAALLKWLPPVQNMNPADKRCLPFYEALAHHRLPLLCHTGGELSLPYYGKAAQAYADPALLIPALERGVTVIAAHCGTKSRPFETDYLPTFLRMAKEHENFYGDTSALNVPIRSYAYEALLNDQAALKKLVHGSDWPIVTVPPARLGVGESLRLIASENNWLRRDVLVKRALGFDDDYWRRGATILRMPPGPTSAT